MNENELPEGTILMQVPITKEDYEFIDSYCQFLAEAMMSQNKAPHRNLTIEMITAGVILSDAIRQLQERLIIEQTDNQ